MNISHRAAVLVALLLGILCGCGPTKGDAKAPVYQWLTEKAKNGKMDSSVKWNFQKYLIDENGELVTMLASGTTPLDEVVINWVEGRK
jgi:glutathione peroxidase